MHWLSEHWLQLLLIVLYLGMLAHHAWAGKPHTADRIKKAYDSALAAGKKTRDIGRRLSTEAIADAIIARMVR